MNTLYRSPIFLLGLAIRLALLLVVVPFVQLHWFVPFLQSAVHYPSLDPWSHFLASGGDPLAFPYGPVMLLAHLPLALAGAGLDALTGGNVFAGLGFRLTLLFADVAALWAMLRLAPGRPRLVLIMYWMSPLAFYISYWHGQTDIVPVALMLAAFVALKQHRSGHSGALFALAISAKLSMALTVPFVLIYIFRNKRLRPLLPDFVIWGIGAAAVALLPWALFSPGFQKIVLGTREAARLYQLSLPIADGLSLYVVPLAYLVMLYACWRMRRSNFELLISVSGVSFMAVVLGTLGAAGWYMWVLPFLVLTQVPGDKGGMILGAGFLALVLVFLAATQSGASVPLLHLDLLPPPNLAVSPRLASLWTTLLVTTGILLMFRMYREGVQGNDYYRLSRKPLCIGIAGDSGVGKDTLARCLGSLFGNHSVAFIFGDAYHKWDRGAPMWRTVTHLNPSANDLLSLTRDILSLLSGRAILRRQYDHTTGFFSHSIITRPRDVVIASGLHVLLPPNLLKTLDLRIYLDASEDLRSFWKLQRDSTRRGQTQESVLRSIVARRPDAEAYIRPQAHHADVVLTLSPVNPEHLRMSPPPAHIPLKLSAVLRNALYADALSRALIAICGLRIDQVLTANGRDIEMVIEGEVDAEDVRLAAHSLLSHLDELLDVQPRWVGDMLGVMQLILLLHIDQVLHGRTTR